MRIIFYPWFNLVVPSYCWGFFEMTSSLLGLIFICLTKECPRDWRPGVHAGEAEIIPGWRWIWSFDVFHHLSVNRRKRPSFQDIGISRAAWRWSGVSHGHRPFATGGPTSDSWQACEMKYTHFKDRVLFLHLLWNVFHTRRMGRNRGASGQWSEKKSDTHRVVEFVWYGTLIAVLHQIIRQWHNFEGFMPWKRLWHGVSPLCFIGAGLVGIIPWFLLLQCKVGLTGEMARGALVFKILFFSLILC